MESYTDGTGYPNKLKDLIEQSLDADKAEDVVSIALDESAALADHMIIASGRSSRQVGAMAEKLAERLKSLGYKDIHIEGMGECNWVIVDAGDAIVHLFRPEVREFYNIEKMWQTPSNAKDNNTVDHAPAF